MARNPTFFETAMTSRRSDDHRSELRRAAYAVVWVVLTAGRALVAIVAILIGWPAITRYVITRSAEGPRVRRSQTRGRSIWKRR